MFCFNSKDSSDVKGSYWRVDRVLLAAGDLYVVDDYFFVTDVKRD